MLSSRIVSSISTGSFLFLFVFGLLLSLPIYVSAQIPGGASASLVVLPTFPEPESNITVSLDAYSMNTVGASINWYVDGKEVVASKNERSILVRSGSLGKKTSVNAQVIVPNGPSFTARRDIIPAVVDLVIEADTYVPAFYRGRALPSGESAIRAIAIPHTGGSLSPSSLTYKWEYNGGVLLGGPVRGKQSINLTMSRFADNRLTVTIIDGNGQSIAEKSLFLNPVDPELHFYEDNPLRGLHERAITDSFALIGDETTLFGEPYYMQTDLTSRTATFSWTINGEKTVYQNPDPHSITLRRSGGGGSAAVELKAMTTAKIPQYIREAFTIVF